MTGALRFEARVRVVTSGGTRTVNGDAVVVRDADAVTLLIAAATSYRTHEDVSADAAARVAAALDPASRKSIETLRAAHIRDYQELFNRVTIDLGSSKRVPTDERVAGFGEGDDPGLAALYFQYGRYLLIASSRTGSQPANLQGLWNESMSPPWGSKYTININTEMNYWPALSTNLAETMDPLTAMVSDLSVTGARTAREMYGAGGWVAHHNTDLWRATGPIDGPQYGMWPTGGAWLTLALWDRYEYTGDRGYLQRIYPLLKGAAQFFLDTLVEEPTHHWLVTSPSLSPENPHPFGTSLTIGPTMDEADPARAVRQRDRGGAHPRTSTPTCSGSGARPARGWRRCRSAAPASCRNGSTTGTCRRRRSTTGTCRTCSASSPGTTSTCAARPNSRPP